MVGMKYPPMPICCMLAMPCILMPAMRWMYCEVSLAVLLPLGQGHVQRLGHDDAAVHLGDRLGGLLGGREADESESLGASLLAHDLGGGDGAVRGELLPEPLIIDGVIQVLDVQVDALV